MKPVVLGLQLRYAVVPTYDKQHFIIVFRLKKKKAFALTQEKDDCLQSFCVTLRLPSRLLIMYIDF